MFGKSIPARRCPQAELRSSGHRSKIHTQRPRLVLITRPPTEGTPGLRKMAGRMITRCRSITRGSSIAESLIRSRMYGRSHSGSAEIPSVTLRSIRRPIIPLAHSEQRARLMEHTFRELFLQLGRKALRLTPTFMHSRSSRRTRLTARYRNSTSNSMESSIFLSGVERDSWAIQIASWMNWWAGGR